MAIDPNTQRPRPPMLSDFAPPQLQGTLAPPLPKKRTAGEIAGDTLRGIGQGASNLATGLAQVPNLLTGGALDAKIVRPAQSALSQALGGPAVSQGLAGASEEISGSIAAGYSPVLKAEQQKLQDADGWFEKAKTVATNPTLLGQFGAEQVPMLATLGAGAAGTASARSAQALAQGATQAAAQQLGKKAAERALIGANAAMGGGFAGNAAMQDAISQPQEVWDANPEYQALVRGGSTPDDAKQQLALKAGQIAGAVAAPISGLAGAITAPLEASIFTRTLGGGVPALFSREGAGIVGRGIAKEAAEEAIQEGGEQFGQNVGIQQAVDPTRALSQDVADNAAIGGVLGGVLGGGLTAGGLALSREPLQDAPPAAGGQPAPQQRRPQPSAPRPPSPAEQEQQLREAVAMAQTPEQATAAAQALAGFLEQQGRLLEPPQTIVGDSQGNLQTNAPTPPQLIDAPRIRLGSVPGGVGSVQQAPRGVPAAPRVPFPDAAPGTLQDAVNAIAEAQPEAAPAAPIAPPLLRAGESIDPETGEVTPRVPSATEQQQLDLQAALAASPTPDLITPAGKRGKERRRDAKQRAASDFPAKPAGQPEQPVAAGEGFPEAPGQAAASDAGASAQDVSGEAGRLDGSAEVRSTVGSADQGNERAAVSRDSRAVTTPPAGADTAAAELVEPTPTPAPAAQEADADGRGRAAEPVAQGGAESVAPVGPVGSGEAAARDADGEPAVEAPVGATAAAAAAPGTTEATAGTTEVDAAAAGFAANTTEGDTDVRTNPEQGPGPQQVERTAEAVEGAAQEEGQVEQPQQLTGEALTTERKRLGLPRVIRKADAVAALRRAGMKKTEAEGAFNTLERKGLKEGTRMGDDVAALIAARTQPAASAPATGEVVESGPASGRAAVDSPAAAPEAAAGAQQDSPAKAKALRRIEKGTAFFATRERADEFITASGIGDTHEAVQAKPGRFDVRPKAQAASAPTEQPTAEALPKRGEEDRKAMAERGIKPGTRVAYEGKDGRVEGVVFAIDRDGTEAEVNGVWVRGLNLEPVDATPAAEINRAKQRLFKARRQLAELGDPALDSENTRLTRQIRAGAVARIEAEIRALRARALDEPEAPAVEAAAAEAATSPANGLPEPTDAQKDAGNYKKGALSLHGLRISIENPAGTRRRPEWPPLAHHYGYIRGTEGKDGDHVDVFLGPDAENADLPVFVVDQVTQAGRFDEHKVMLGFADEAAARAGYLANYSKGWKGLGDITPMALADFKAWVADPARTTKRASADKQAAQQQAAPKSTESRFAKNKLVPESAIEAAKARLRAKLGQLNSGLDPELLTDGMTIAAGYIEAGVRNFADFTAEMAGDFGDRIRPYLLSFWEGARNYPGLDSEGMTSPEEAREFHKANNVAPQPEEAAAVGTVEPKPKKRTPKRGRPEDATLTQDWGVEHIDAYTDQGEQVKKQFLREGAAYLRAVADVLQERGFTPHTDSKGRPEKPVSTNEGGVAGSGEVSLTLRNPAAGVNVHVQVAGSSLRGVVPGTASGVSVLARAGTSSDRYATRSDDSGNRWLPTDLSALDLAGMLETLAVQTAEQKARRDAAKPSGATNEQSEQAEQGIRGGDPAGARSPEGGRERAAQPGSAPPDPADVAAAQPADVVEPGARESGGAAGVRAAGTDVAGEREPDEGRNARARRSRAGGAKSPDAGTGERPAAADRERVKAPESVSPANPGPGNFHIANPLEIVGGGQVARFNKNQAAIEKFIALRDEGRKPTREEQEILAGYTGWGSFGQELFQGTWARPAPKDGWEKRDQWLRDHLGQAEWEGMQRSITNAHYTDPPTVLAMWDMVRRMGFTGGRVLEPSMGIGNFFGMMPLDLKERSQLAGIELDPITGGMAQLLYPDATVKVMGYQDSKTPDDFYDVVIGNWPFENTPVADRRYNRLNPMLHDYFFLKTLDQVRPGGIVIGITSAGSMDKKGAVVRRELAKKAELVAAFRLPSGAFEEYAGTKVVTDIVILRKRPEPVSNVDGEVWVETVEVDTPSGEKVRVNAYYKQNPQNVVGTIDFGSGTTAFRAGMIVRRPADMAEQLARIVSMVPESAYKTATRADSVRYIANHTSDREGALTRTDAGLFIVRGEHLAPANEVQRYEVKSEKDTAARVAQLDALIGMRRSYGQLIEAERGTSGADPEPIRKRLRGEYESFVKAHGALSDSFGLNYLRRIDDPFYYALAALEVQEGGKTRPATILSQSTIRTQTRIENPSIADAYVLARNGTVNPSAEEIAKIARQPVERVRAELVQSGAVFETPAGDIIPSDMYLSGNVREKLRQAREAVAEGNKALQRNVEALEKVQPADIPYFNIEVQMGASWVPTRAYEQFIAHMLNRTSTEGIEVSYTMGRWKAVIDPRLQKTTEAETGFGTDQYPFGKLVNAAISNQTVKIKRRDSDGNEFVDTKATEEANGKIADMREKFGEWLWSDPERRVEIEREYNEVRNAYASPKFDGSFLGFEGMALSLGRGPFNLREHQVNAIWRALVMRRSLNAHEVGTGKTFTMGGIAVESRRYGIAKKPMLLAHNANSKSVAAEIQMMYPAAKVLYIDNLSPKTIDVRMRQIANDDWDVVVIPHSLIERLSFREDTLMGMAREEIEALEEEAREAAREDGADLTDAMLDDPDELKKLRSRTAKELVKMRARIIETIKKQAQQASREGAVPFEDLGIDMVLVDEAHEFKKPPFATRMEMKGMQTQSSLGSIQLSFLTRYIRDQNAGGNVHLFTGTPITNTLTEIFHQMRYIMADEMAAVGVDQWDGWFGSFAKEVQDVELTAAGDYEAVNRLRGFINVPELRKMIGQYMDVVFADDMPEMQPRRTRSGKLLADQNLTEAERAELLNGRTENAKDRPYKRVLNETADPTPEQMRIFGEVQALAARWRQMTGKQRKEAMTAGAPVVPIVYEQLAARASFDARMADDEALAGQEGQVPDHPDSKISRAIRNLLEVYNSDKRATQVVFTNTGLGTTANRAIRAPDGSALKDGDGNTLRRSVRVFSPMLDMVERLVQQGVPREEIAIVDGSTSKDKRKEVADAMNAGTIRIVIGSTQSLGVGVNMQRNLRAMHHLDAPWMPGDLEQRNGRGHRQGNQWNTVLEYRYITDRIDGRRWQVLAIKQKFITDFLKADGETRVIEGDAASDEESDILSTFAEAAGDPRVLIRQKLAAQIEQLQKRERLHTSGIADAKGTARIERENVAALSDRLKAIEAGGLEAMAEQAVSANAGAGFRMQVDGGGYDTRADAGEALDQWITANMRAGMRNEPVGSYGGLPVLATWPFLADAPVLVVRIGDESVTSGRASIASLEASLRGFGATVEKLRAQVESTRETIRRLDEVAAQPFQRAEQLARVQQQLERLDADMAANPVPPPAWLRSGAPMDTAVFWRGTEFAVVGHRWTPKGWFVVAQDAAGGEVVIPYLEAKDAQGMALYEEREFEAPVVHENKAKTDGASSAPAEPGQFSLPEPEPQPVFYSAALRAIEEGKGAPRRGDAAAWRGWLDGAVRRGDMKQSERDWLDIDGWLGRQDGPVTREALAEFVRANEVQVSETVLGVAPSDSPSASELARYRELERREQNESITDAEQDELDSMRNEGAYEDGDQRNVTDPKFAKYRLPGGENYRELLLTLPDTSGAVMTAEQQLAVMNAFKRKMLDKYGPNWLNKATPEELEENRALSIPAADAAISAERAAYRSSHWDQRNVLAHIRMDERTDAEGKRVLFVQEIQSDWHQAGRKQGYASDRLKGLVAADAGGYWEVRDSAGNFVTNVTDQGLTSEQAVAEARRRLQAEPERTGRSVPDAPLKQTDEWAMLAFKRAARWAVDNGFDRIAWATGEQNAELFDLSKTISRVEYTDSGMLLAEDNSGRSVIRESVAEDKLADYIGKEAAEKLLAQKPSWHSGLSSTTARSRVLEGQQLKVCGEGMRGFYDKILPAAVSKWAKKFGAKVGETEFVGVDGPNDATSVHAIDITPAMVEAVAKGQPLFSDIPSRPPAGAGVAPSQLQAAIAAVVQSWNADTAPRVRVLADPEGLPARAKRDPRYRRAEGFFDQSNRTIYLVASNLPTERRAMQVLAHEAVGHYGMEAITGPELWAELETSIARLEQTATGRVGEALASARRRYAGADRATFTKEAIAVMAERGVQNSIVARVVAAVRRFLRSLGFDLRLSESDVLAMIRDSARYLERGRQPTAEQAVTGAAFARPDLDPKRSVPIINAPANRFGPTTTQDERTAARAAAAEFLKGAREAGPYTNAESGLRLGLSAGGNRELLAWTADPSKLDLLGVLPQIAEQSMLAKVEAGRGNERTRFATFYAPVRVGDAMRIARMVAREAGNGVFVYDLQQSALLEAKSPEGSSGDIPATKAGASGERSGPRAMTVAELRAAVNADPREAWNWSMPADRLPGLTVPERTTAAGVLRTMAEQGGLFRYPPSRATDLATVFDEVTEGTVSATYKGETLANFTEDLEDMAEVQKWEIRTKDGRPMFVYVEIGGENRMYVDASPGRSGASMGSAVYAALFQYALNDGKVMMGDPNGLSPEALLRRTEHMLSAALKHGTTRMMAPHPRQVDPSQPQWDSGPQAWAHPLRWQPGNDEANLRALIETTYHNAAAFMRGTDGEGAVYSFPAKKFLTRDGRELTQADIARISKQAGKSWRAGLAEPLGNPNVSLIGPTTVARSIIAGTLLRAEDSQLAKPLLADMNRRVQAGAAEPAQGLFYSLREPEAMGAAADPRGFLDRLSGLVKPDNVSLREAIGAKLQDIQPAALGALTLRHIAELGRKYLPQLPSYIDNLNRMQTDRNVLQEEGNELAEKWRGMQTKDRNSARDMADLMHDATIEGVDPAEEYRPLTFVNLSRETVPITDAALKDHIKRKRAQFRSRPGDDKRAEMEEIKVLRQKLAAEKRRRRSYPQLVARWNQLPAEWQALYREARDMYSKRSDQTMEALMARVGELDMPDEQKRKTGAQIRLMFEQARVSGPYFPLQRFGNYWLAAKNPDTGKRDFFMFESAADQLAGERDLKSQGYTDMASGKKLEQARDAFGAGEGFMSEVQRKLQKARVPEDLQDEIWQLYLRTLPDLSQRKHMIHRKKVAGYNPDALRAFAANANHGAYQVARLRYGHKMQRLVMQAKTWADSSAKTDQGNQAAVYYNELVKRHDWVMNPSDSALVNKISGLGFAWYLGVTPGAALVNLTQTAIVAGPVLASRFGAAKAMNALTKGMRDSIRTGGNIERTLRDEELQAYQAMRASGAVDKTQAHNLAGIAEVDSAQYSDSWHRVMKGISFLFHKAEVVNREATGMAAYRLGREQGMSFDAAVQYAENVIWESHFDYSNANRARFMQSGAAKVLLMFRQYSLSMSYFLWRNFYQTFKGETPKVKAEARRKLLGVLGMTAVFSGALGLPAMSMVFGVANAMADALGDDDDAPFDAEAEFRNFLADFMGADVARLIARGPVNFITGADVASRVTLDGLWLREPERELEGKALANYWLEQAAGPIGGIFVNAMQGLSLFQQGEAWRGVEAMTPKFVKDALRSIRYSTEGVNTLRGDALIPDLSPAQTVFQLAGLAPAQVNERYDANNAVKRYEEAILRRRQRLLDGFALSVRLEDERMRERTMQHIRAFNQANPEIPIDAKTIRTSLQARARYSERSLGGIAVNPKIEARAREQGRFAEDGQ